VIAEPLQVQLAAIGWVDWVLFAVLLLSMLVGLCRGLVFELLALAGWLAAWFGAQWSAPVIAPHLPVGTPGGPLEQGVAFTLGFVGLLLAWALASRLVRLLIHATPLALPDRLLGGLFGALRGVIALLALATVVALTPAAQSQHWRASQGARWLGHMLSVLEPLLPEPAAQWLGT
jgi:membrane protein required for colicin V production